MARADRYALRIPDQYAESVRWRRRRAGPGPIRNRSQFFAEVGHARPGLLHVSHRSLSRERNVLKARTDVNRRRRAGPEEVSCVQTVLERPATDVALSELFPAQPDSLPATVDGVLEEALGGGAAMTDFSACYARELSSVVWFVMSLGADAHRAADVAQSTFAEAFVVWDRIQHPTAWLRRVAGRFYYRHLVPQETGLADLDGALDIQTGRRAILAQDPPTEMRTLARDAEMRDAQVRDQQAPRLSA